VSAHRRIPGREHGRRGASVTVNIDPSFTPEQRTGIENGFRNWQAANGANGNNSQVTFTFTSNSTPVTGANTFQVNRAEPSFNVGSRAETSPFEGATNLTRAVTSLSPRVTDQAALTEVIAHEIGHTFGLGDCPTCSGTQSVMGPAPPGVDQNPNLTDGVAGPLSCDNAVVTQIGQYPTPTPTPTPTPRTENCTRTSSGCPIYYRWRGYPTCECVPSPILVDVRGDGLVLSSAGEGVYFDLDGDGTPERRAWTLDDSDDAWLALDRNGNGIIDGSAELFGDRTPQPMPPIGVEMNGFLALAEFDRRENGGNGNGWIDSHDAIFSSLRLWQDVNHNGVSEPNELHTLAAMGLLRFDLDYKASKRIDQHGNEFGYRAKVRDERGAQLGRWAWDVFLVHAP
jgi:hypothetical protein